MLKYPAKGNALNTLGLHSLLITHYSPFNTHHSPVTPYVFVILPSVRKFLFENACINKDWNIILLFEYR
jgi:hypothetical protein